MDKQRELAIQNITDIMRSENFTFEFVVRKHPKGLKISYEVTQEQLNEIMNKAKDG